MTTCTVQRAEALLRSLVGITAAEVRLSASGRLELVRVATACPLSNGQVVQNVRSALFAGLGMRLDPAQVELVDPKTWVSAPVDTGSDKNPVEIAPSAPTAPPKNGNGNGNGAIGHAPVTNGNGYAPSPAAGSNGNGNGSGTKPAASPIDADARAALVRAGAGSDAVIPGVVAPSPRAASPAPAAVNGAVNVAVSAPHGVTASLSGIKIESVEFLRQGGRVRCRVSLTSGQARFAAIADAAEDSVPEFQLAARVTCDTIRAAQLSSAHFDGATVAQLAGRTHVVVALSEWKAGNQHVNLTGSAVVTDRLEHAAAAAVLQALRRA